MPAIQTVNANLDGSGQQFVVQGWDDAGTSVSLNGNILEALNGSRGQTHIAGPGPANPPNSGWNRTTADEFFAGDVDGDGRDEVILINGQDGWIGILKWNGTSLTYVNGSSPPVMGPGAAIPPGSGWRLDHPPNEFHLVVDCDNDGKMEVFLWNDNDLWVGVLNCATQPVSYVWGCKGAISGPAGTWIRGASDYFTPGSYEGKSGIAVEGWTTDNNKAYGFLIFENGALELVHYVETHPPTPTPTPPPTTPPPLTSTFFYLDYDPNRVTRIGNSYGPPTGNPQITQVINNSSSDVELGIEENGVVVVQAVVNAGQTTPLFNGNSPTESWVGTVTGGNDPPAGIGPFVVYW